MKTIKHLSNLLRTVAGYCLLGMIILTCLDVFGSFFGYPIMGSEEIVGMMASILLAFSLPFAEFENAHVGVDLLHMRLPVKVRKVNDTIVSFISCIFFVLVGWQCFLYARILSKAGEVSTTLQLPTYYLIYGISLSCIILALVIFFEFMALRKGGTNE